MKSKKKNINLSKSKKKKNTLKKIKIVGWKDCFFFQKAKNELLKYQKENNNSIKLEIIEKNSRDNYKSWLNEKKNQKNILFKDKKANEHNTSPIIWINKKYLGGYDNVLGYLSKKYKKRNSTVKLC